jgi:hypothetical protein
LPAQLRLEQEIRYDIFWQGHADGATTENYGGSKGLELIPAKNTEVIIGIPPLSSTTIPSRRTAGATRPFW